MSFWASVESFFKSALSSMEAWLKPAAAYLVANGGPILVAAAEQAVAAIAADPSVVSNSDKRDAAGKLILAQMQAQGIPVAVSAINLAIEAALAAAKAKAAQ